MTKNLTANLVAACNDLNYSNLPVDVIDRAKYFTLDSLGVAVRGMTEESSKVMLEFLESIDAMSGGGVVVGTGKKVAYHYAAMINGAACHALELDDVINESSLHPGTVIIPAALAASEMVGATGKSFVEAVVVGYEVMSRLGAALNPKVHYARGFHPSGTCGVFGATAAAAKIFGLSEKETVMALGLAGSQAAGSMEFLTEGAWSKRFQVGWAAHSGILASMLAKRKYTGPTDIIGGRFGFLHAYSDNVDPSKVTDGWGEGFQILNCSIKPHACCRYMQPGIDGVLEIVKENKLKMTDIKEVTIGILEAGAAIIAEPAEVKYNPQTTYEAQFSMPYGTAAAIIFGKLTLDIFTQENLRDQRIRDLIKKVKCVPDPELDKAYPKQWQATVTIETVDGQKFYKKVEYPKGDPENALTWEELINKASDLTKNIYSQDDFKKIVSGIREIDKEEDMRNFGTLMMKKA